MSKKEQGSKGKMSKAQQMTLLEVLITSVILGGCVVLGGFLIQYIKFNTTIIPAKEAAISEYGAALINVGICSDSDNNGRLSDAELKVCNPDETSLDSVVGSLRYNIYKELASDENLESVARQRNPDGDCYDQNGLAVDYVSLYRSANNENEREQALKGMRVCSALRVISDALPSQKNTEALMASLNQIFLTSGMEPESIAPSTSPSMSDVANVEAIPVGFLANGTEADLVRFLNNLERSIRIFNVNTGLFQWAGGTISLNVSGDAYYLDEGQILEGTKTLRAKSGGK